MSSFISPINELYAIAKINLFNEQFMKQKKQSSFIGYIYKISHPMINGVYIGQTVKTPEERFKEHAREANGNRRPSKGAGALYEVIRAFGPDKFKVEKIGSAKSKKELNDLEAYHIKQYNSKQSGLNRVNPPQTEPKIIQSTCTIKINGKNISYSSIKELCRILDIPYTSLLYWVNKRHESIKNAIKRVIEGAKKQNEKGFYCFRKKYKTYTELSNDKRINRYKLTGREIAARVRNGLSVEDAIKLPKQSKKSIILSINGEQIKYANISEAYKSLSVKYKLPSYSAIVQRISNGESPEEAFGLIERPWKNKFSNLNK